ncbi:MAG: RpiB/LacA/LacB family sugar-phosphate isomerase [Bacteroidales bacterium]|nr:RpiB/LacA/LacB family sugar-phosphate isomerase [Bacteroidales bacterium]
MTIGICNDHAGVEYKDGLVKYLQGKGCEVVNFGTDTPDSMDYPDVAHPLAEAVLAGKVELGIALCGTGNGMALCLNHHKGIRAGLAWTPEVGRLVKAHNNANVLVMPARFISYSDAEAIVDQWLSEPFEGGRHQRRVDKIEP